MWVLTLDVSLLTRRPGCLLVDGSRRGFARSTGLGWDVRASGIDRSLVFLVEFLSYGGDLTQLEFGEARAAPGGRLRG